MADAGATLNPQLRYVLDAAERARAGELPFHQRTPAAARTWMAERFVPVWNRPVLPIGRVEDVALAGLTGPIRVRHYDPGLSAPAPVLLYLHGGGWTIGDVDTHDDLCRRLAFVGARRVLAVDYRLAPEHPFPAGLDDAKAALAFVLDHGAAMGLDPARVAVGGDSAGAHLALAATMARRDEGRSLPSSLLLIYGSYRYRFDGPDWDRFGHLYFLLSRADTVWFWQNFVGAGYVAGSDVRVEPLLGDLAGLPPAYVVGCDHDPLFDDSRALVDGITAAGGEATLDVWRGLTHASAQFARAVDAVVVGLERIGRSLRPTL
ncbi:MAG: alpha/beta hydrolase [Pseudomonadota bacterium]